MDALALPAGRLRRSTSSPAASGAASRSASCCSSSPTCCSSTSRPTTSTPRRSAWLEGHLRTYPGAILIVTHDRYFLDNVTGWILELDRGRGIPYEGNYSSWLEQKQKRLAQEGREEEARQRTIEREREWVVRLARRRARRSPRRASSATRSSSPRPAEKGPTTAQIIIPIAERLGDNVIEFEDLKKAYGDKLLIDDLSFKLPPGGIVGVIGPNGAGKTTLFRMITGQEKPDAGAITHRRDASSSATSTSRRDSLDANKTVWEEISGGNEILYLGKREMNSRAYCARLQLQGRRTSRRRSACSRAASATACTSPRS